MTWRTLTRTAGALLLTVTGRSLAAQDQIPWQSGPVEGSLGSQSKVQVGGGCQFADKDGTKAFLTLTQNPVGGSERGTVLCTIVREGADSSYWFAVFDYDASGYIKDDERSSLDADAILTSLKEGNEAGNEERKRRGWERLDLVGWEKAPYYDPATNLLTWATRVRAESDGESINHSVRLLGRAGVMKVDLVTSPEDYNAALDSFNELIASHDFNAGFRYAEWRDGDKVAQYGLTALVAGGAGVLALKSGFFGKFLKLIIAGVVALGAGLKRLFRKKPTESAS